MLWTINLHRKVVRVLPKLPRSVQDSLAALLREIELRGPVRGNWPNYSRLGPNRHHCHLKKGRTTYVAVWERTPTSIHLVEVTYVGTHEKAPY
jgi:mRNA-degrading endonuclease RelE of RelBE toxin-antitoxin system